MRVLRLPGNDDLLQRFDQQPVHLDIRVLVRGRSLFPQCIRRAERGLDLAQICFEFCLETAASSVPTEHADQHDHAATDPEDVLGKCTKDDLDLVHDNQSPG